MLLNLKTGNRSSLSKSQREFLERIIPWSLFIQNQTKEKARVFKRLNSPYGIFPSVAMADFIINSQWGEHPLSQEKYKNKPANNLSLLEVTPGWSGKQIKFNEKIFKLFQNWEDFSIHYSDQIVFSGWFKNLLESNSPEDQLVIFSLNKTNDLEYNSGTIFQAKAETIIEFYGLRELDV